MSALRCTRLRAIQKGDSVAVMRVEQVLETVLYADDLERTARFYRVMYSGWYSNLRRKDGTTFSVVVVECY